MRGWGLETRLFEPDNEKMKVFPDYSPGHSYRNRPNLVATLKGAGSGRSLILNGHVDTMPDGRPVEMDARSLGRRDRGRRHVRPGRLRHEGRAWRR